ncbi:hypothetical protein ACO0LC_10865 [Undibacterium sp. JH2W]|uniref:hypothetical protein n=1 Tax=Undibacterium sp. JH2W TaxID=3413037 RepID=UPI003BF31392
MNYRINALLTLTAALSIAYECQAANEIALKGRYEFRTDTQSQDSLGGLVCFYPGSDSAKILPRSPTDKRLAWFCFKNKDESKKLLNIPEQIKGKNCGISGQAALKVANYVSYNGEGDGVDTVVLVAVTEKSAPRKLACKE